MKYSNMKKLSSIAAVPSIIFFSFACQSNAQKNDPSKDPRVVELDSIKNEVAIALAIIDTFPLDVIRENLQILHPFYTFFSETNYTFDRSVYINELSQLEEYHKAFRKALTQITPLKEEGDLAYQQLSRLRTAYEHHQISKEDFAKHFDEEREAASVFLFEFRKRITKALDKIEGFDELVEQLRQLKSLALS